ncbi:Peptidase S8, subtilisin-related [Parasponia andersonii]|uniref:Peptidase S8, subtilisin-related n=1 Tax=Parasponia andersonii TaxID=3476 RepID=A0A2P5D4H4_PARAD|nr:Peptidase S8, subtilisin-related [Parasponia andersonii]
MPKAFDSTENWYSSIVESLKPPNITSSNDKNSLPSLIYTYDDALHGFSASLSQEGLGILEQTPGFVLAYRDTILKLDTTYTPEFLSLDSSSSILISAEYGEDVIFGVIDTSIWPESDSFRDEGIPRRKPTRWKGRCEGGEDFNSSMCNFRLIGATYYNKAVASIIAGNYVKNASYFGYALGTAKGMAFRARIAVYKVSWIGASSSSDFVAGVNQAIADGVDVISISLSNDDEELTRNVVLEASFSAMEKGLLVCVSGGNTSPDLGTVRNGIPWALTVGAGSISRWFAGTLTLGNGMTVVGWTLYPGEAPLKNLPLIYDS